MSFATLDGMYDRTVTINGFAKGYAMTGWRLGYIGAPLWIAKACTKVQGQITSGANSFAQRAAADALDGDQTPTREMCAAFLRRRDLMVGLINEIPGFRANTPTGAFYLFPDVSGVFGKSDGTTTITDADELAMYLLGDAHVACVSGADFGSDECLRLSFAASEEQLKEAARRIKAAVEKLK